MGFEDISLFFLFPHLYREEQQSSRLRDEDFRNWTDDILLPIIYDRYRSSHVQHYPSSYDHGRYNATAHGVETRRQRTDPVSREQQLMYYLPPEHLAQVWESIMAAVQQPGFCQFRDVTILLQAKNLKVLTKDTTWERMITRFDQYWSSAVNEDYVTSELYSTMMSLRKSVLFKLLVLLRRYPSQTFQWMLKVVKTMPKTTYRQRLFCGSDAVSSLGAPGCNKAPPTTPLDTKSSIH